MPRSPFSSDVDDILSLIGDSVVSTEQNGLIILFNRAAEELLGYVSAEILGSPVEVLIPTRFHDQHRTEVGGFVSAMAPTHHSMGVGREVLGKHRNGHELAIETTLASHMLAGKQVFHSCSARRYRPADRRTEARAGCWGSCASASQYDGDRQFGGFVDRARCGLTARPRVYTGASFRRNLTNERCPDRRDLEPRRPQCAVAVRTGSFQPGGLPNIDRSRRSTGGQDRF